MVGTMRARQMVHTKRKGGQCTRSMYRAHLRVVVVRLLLLQEVRAAIRSPHTAPRIEAVPLHESLCNTRAGNVPSVV